MEEPIAGATRVDHRVEHHVDLHRADAYGRSFADVYDRWYHDVSDAEATARFVADRCPGGTVIELGVGSGRLAVPMIQRGLTVIGLDGSESMLARCPARRSLSLVRADMRSLPFRGSVDAVLIAFNTLFNLSSEAQQLGLLTEVETLLGPDGVLIVEAVDVSPLLAGPRRSIGVRQTDETGLVVTATQLDQHRQTMSGQHLEITDHGISVRPWHLRWLTPGQLDRLAGVAGLAPSERFRSWHGEPLTADGETHISIYRPAGS